MNFLPLIASFSMLGAAVAAATLFGLELSRRAHRAQVSQQAAERHRKLQLDLAASCRASDRLMSVAMARKLTADESHEFKRHLQDQAELRVQLEGLTDSAIASVA